MEFREMRRKRQRLSREESEAVLERNSSGVLAVLGDMEYPYAVPLSYVYFDNLIYFHCARSGHKLDAITAHDKVSFCVIDKDEVVPEEYTTRYRSVIAFGRAKIVADDKEIRMAIEKLAQKYAPDDAEDNRNAAIDRDTPRMAIVKIEVEHLSGKEAIELVKNRG